MDRQPEPYWINVSLTMSSRAEHYLKREFSGKGKLRTACGKPEYHDGIGKHRRGQRDAYKITLGCSECNAWLNEALRKHEREERMRLYGYGTEQENSVHTGGHLQASPDCKGGYEGLDEPCVRNSQGPAGTEGKPVSGSGGCYSSDVLGDVSEKGAVMAQQQREPEPTTEEGKTAQLLDRVNKAMVALWGPLPLADMLCSTEGMEQLGAKLRSHQIGAIPLLREISTELQCKLDNLVRVKYNLDTSSSAAQKPKKT